MDPAALGIPTLWSAALDSLAAGQDLDIDDDGITLLDAEEPGKRTARPCGGWEHPRPHDVDHLGLSDGSPAEAPAQDWNAIVVGGCTFLDHQPTEPGLAEYTVLALAGELSPLSRTNDGRDQSGDRSRRTLVGQLRADHPDLWPETIRGLTVASARWTPEVAGHFGATVDTKLPVIRRYGWGVPDLDRARRSATDVLTLIAERTIQPFEKGSMREMPVHELPWPVDVLEALGALECRMRVALSYFIEPHPARRGWFRRYQYPSHGLRFSVRRPTETTDELRARVNKDARGDQASGGGGGPGNWVIGPQQRHKGSLHVDQLTCSAAELTARGCIAVYPTGGWWKDLQAAERRDRSVRYSLVVTIETPGVDAHLDARRPTGWHRNWAASRIRDRDLAGLLVGRSAACCTVVVDATVRSGPGITGLSAQIPRPGS